MILCQVGSTAWASSTLDGTKSQALLDVIENRFPAVLDAHAADSIRGRARIGAPPEAPESALEASARLRLPPVRG